MQDVSATGIKATVQSSITFPAGFEVSAFADDADPITSADLQIVEHGMSVNGDLVTWSAPKAIPLTLNVIANTEEDNNLNILYNANRVAKNKISVRDVVTIVLTYPDGTTKTATMGKITNATPIRDVASNGKIKSRAYGFIFEQLI